ncbi:hypothetical protein QTQ03_18815 [Micromonospora sp. WMMA1363]|uniref:hypothetical protein n=1 Tax=Micromonospora sp. WMMA1363 TaxID=3053985 RepID=UPI00259D0222|nr:hypothetical protein [Micromonospora sp. WMMA1363]MDM4721542.1 hypothetical protein [Micromonospora sp. WMMA1363]
MPADICDRLDYDLAGAALGSPLPLPAEDLDQGPGFRCDKWFFDGGGKPGGFVHVTVRAANSPTEARTGFDQTAPASSASPFPGGDAINADGIRYQRLATETTIDVVDANLFVGVRLVTREPMSAEVKTEVAVAAVHTTQHVLQLIQGTEDT